MPTSTNVTNLKINELTESQYDTAVQQGVIGANEISILTDAEAGQVIQVATLPTASADELGNIYQFVGTTDANYTNGYFYKCVSDGAATPTYSWTNIQVQASSGGLPSQTGNAGKFLITDGTDASWGTTVADDTLNIRRSTGSNMNHYIRLYNNSNNDYTTIACRGGYELSISNYIGGTYTGTGVISAQIFRKMSTSLTCSLGDSTHIWDNTYTAKINNGADITVPAVAGEIAVKQVNTTITLTSAGWSSNTQTVNVTGMTATGVVFPCPIPADQSAYTSAGILCTAQASGTLTFTCDTVPSADIDVNVVML